MLIRLYRQIHTFTPYKTIQCNTPPRQVRDKKTARITDVVELSLPPMEYDTAALWTELPGTRILCVYICVCVCLVCIYVYMCLCVYVCVMFWLGVYSVQDVRSRVRHSVCVFTPPIPSFTPLQARSNAASAPCAGSPRGPISTGTTGACTRLSTSSSRWPPWSCPATRGT